MRLETPFVIDGDLLIVEAIVTGPRGTVSGRFVLDTGAVLTTVIPELVESFGYSARDGFKRARVHTAIGEEEGYALRVAGLAVLGFTMPRFPVHVFGLGSRAGFRRLSAAKSRVDERRDDLHAGILGVVDVTVVPYTIRFPRAGTKARSGLGHSYLREPSQPVRSYRNITTRLVCHASRARGYAARNARLRSSASIRAQLAVVLAALHPRLYAHASVRNTRFPGRRGSRENPVPYQELVHRSVYGGDFFVAVTVRVHPIFEGPLARLYAGNETVEFFRIQTENATE